MRRVSTATSRICGEPPRARGDGNSSLAAADGGGPVQNRRSNSFSNSSSRSTNQQKMGAMSVSKGESSEKGDVSAPLKNDPENGDANDGDEVDQDDTIPQLGKQNGDDLFPPSNNNGDTIREEGEIDEDEEENEEENNEEEELEKNESEKQLSPSSNGANGEKTKSAEKRLQTDCIESANNQKQQREESPMTETETTDAALNASSKSTPRSSLAFEDSENEEQQEKEQEEEEKDEKEMKGEIDEKKQNKKKSNNKIESEKRVEGGENHREERRDLVETEGEFIDEDEEEEENDDDEDGKNEVEAKSAGEAILPSQNNDKQLIEKLPPAVENNNNNNSRTTNGSINSNPRGQSSSTTAIDPGGPSPLMKRTYANTSKLCPYCDKYISRQNWSRHLRSSHSVVEVAEGQYAPAPSVGAPKKRSSTFSNFSLPYSSSDVVDHSSVVENSVGDEQQKGKQQQKKQQEEKVANKILAPLSPFTLFTPSIAAAGQRNAGNPLNCSDSSVSQESPESQLQQEKTPPPPPRLKRQYIHSGAYKKCNLQKSALKLKQQKQQQSSSFSSFGGGVGEEQLQLKSRRERPVKRPTFFDDEDFDYSLSTLPTSSNSAASASKRLKLKLSPKILKLNSPKFAAQKTPAALNGTSSSMNESGNSDGILPVKRKRGRPPLRKPSGAENELFANSNSNLAATENGIMMGEEDDEIPDGGENPGAEVLPKKRRRVLIKRTPEGHCEHCQNWVARKKFVEHVETNHPEFLRVVVCSPEKRLSSEKVAKLLKKQRKQRLGPAPKVGSKKWRLKRLGTAEQIKAILAHAKKVPPPQSPTKAGTSQQQMGPPGKVIEKVNGNNTAPTSFSSSSSKSSPSKMAAARKATVPEVTEFPEPMDFDDNTITENNSTFQQKRRISSSSPQKTTINKSGGVKEAFLPPPKVSPKRPQKSGSNQSSLIDKNEKGQQKPQKTISSSSLSNHVGSPLAPPPVPKGSSSFAAGSAARNFALYAATTDFASDHMEHLQNPFLRKCLSEIPGFEMPSANTLERQMDNELQNLFTRIKTKLQSSSYPISLSLRLLTFAGGADNSGGTPAGASEGSAKKVGGGNSNSQQQLLALCAHTWDAKRGAVEMRALCVEPIGDSDLTPGDLEKAIQRKCRELGLFRNSGGAGIFFHCTVGSTLGPLFTTAKKAFFNPFPFIGAHHDPEHRGARVLEAGTAHIDRFYRAGGSYGSSQNSSQNQQHPFDDCSGELASAAFLKKVRVPDSLTTVCAAQGLQTVLRSVLEGSGGDHTSAFLINNLRQRVFRLLQCFASSHSACDMLCQLAGGHTSLLFPANTKWATLGAAYKRMLDLREHLAAVCAEYATFTALADADFDTMKSLLQIADTFQKFAQKLERSANGAAAAPTISLLRPGLEHLISTLELEHSTHHPDLEPLVAALTGALREEFSAVLSHPLYLAASVLDPAIASFLSLGQDDDEEGDEKRMEEAKEAVCALAKRVFDHCPDGPYSAKNLRLKQREQSVAASEVSLGDGGGDSTEGTVQLVESPFGFGTIRQRRKRPSSPTGSTVGDPSGSSGASSGVDQHLARLSTVELPAYLEAVMGDAEAGHSPLGPCANAFEFWTANEKRFPVLAHVARSILAIPATSSAGAGRLLDAYVRGIRGAPGAPSSTSSSAEHRAKAVRRRLLLQWNQQEIQQQLGSGGGLSGGVPRSRLPSTSSTK